MDRIDQRFTCTVCGSELRFGPGQNRLACPHCGREQSIPGTPASRLATQRGHPIAKMQPDLPPEPTDAEFPPSVCSHCGAEVAFDGITYASDCPYCGTSVVHVATESSHFSPKAILPFAVSEDEAYRFVMQRLKDDPFTPPEAVFDIRLRPKLKGVFLPFWVFGGDSETDFTVNRATSSYEETDSSGFVGGVRKTNWKVVDDRLPVAFDDVLVRASANPPVPFDTGLAPWDLAALVPFQRDYVAGFHAELATIPPVDAHRDARHTMHAAIRLEVQRSLAADEVRFIHSDTRFTHETFKLVLLPFWIAEYRANRQTYWAYVNGQTGKTLAQISDIYPKVGWSGWRAMLLLTPLLLALALIAFGAIGMIYDYVFPAP